MGRGATTFGDRVREARQDRRYTQRDLGKRAGLSGAAIAQWESGDTNPENIKQAPLRAVCRELGVRAEWLLSGVLPKHPVSTGAETLDFANASYAPADTRSVPVISFVQAGFGTEAVDPYPRGQGDETIGVDADLAKQLSRVAFALKIEGNSMSPEFVAGDVIIVDPEVFPLPGDYVVAKIDGETKATFKKYRDRGASPNGTPVFELVPLNADYPTVTVNGTNPGRIIGTMIEHRKRRRR